MTIFSVQSSGHYMEDSPIFVEDGDSSVLLMASREPKNYRCTKGHEWRDDEPGFSGIAGAMYVGLNGETTTFCFRCLVERYREQLGVVEEVTP